MTLALLAALHLAAAPVTVEMFVGAEKVIAVPGLERFELVPLTHAFEVHRAEHEALRVVAKDEGRTRIVVWLTDGRRLEYRVSARFANRSRALRASPSCCDLSGRR